MLVDKNTVAVITGAGGGIGRALAICLARHGAALAIADVNAEGLNETANAIGAQVMVTTHVVDVSDRGQMAAFAEDVVRSHGRASLVINNAGVGLHGTIEEVSIDDIEWLMRVNFWGVVHGVKYFLPILRGEKEAHIVNISSIFGIIAPAGQGAYAASKFAVRGLTEALRHELAGSNVRVSVVHPGGVKTAIAKNARMGAAADRAVAGKMMANFERNVENTPEDIAAMIVKGIKENRLRILAGRDARQLALIQRLMPVKYWRIVGPELARLLDKA